VDVAPTVTAAPAAVPTAAPPVAAITTLYEAQVDWRNRFGRSFLTTIQNQGGCECCWFFDAAALVETMVCIEHGVTGALDWIVKNGVADPDCYGYVGADHLCDPTVDRVGRTTRVASYTNLGNVTDQKVWLDSIGPIACGFDVYYDFFA
jgi:hypothetical protein